MRTIMKSYVRLMIAATVVVSGNAASTERGVSNFLNGVEQFAMAYVPPPGVYYMLHAFEYNANDFRNNVGNRVELPLNMKIQGIAPRAAWVTRTKIFGGRLVFQGVLPLLKVESSDVSFTPTGQVLPRSGATSGIGDVELGAGLGYSPSEELHYGFGLHVIAPTGAYNSNSVANLGRNYWSVRPKFAITYLDPEGLNADLRLSYSFNRRNDETNYASGQELSAEYAIGWGVTKDLVAGIGGYTYLQTTDDKLNGTTLPDSGGRVFAIGPALKYDNGYGLLVTAAYEKEYAVKNRFAGDIVSIRMLLPF